MDHFLKIYFIHGFFLLFISILIFGYIFFDIEFLKGNNIDEYSNNFCESNPSSIICKNKYKKNKFIWIILDGNAYDELFLLRNKAKIKLPIIFRGQGKGYKQTNQLFTEMFSGVPSRNNRCKEIKTDQIFKQLHKSNYKIHFIGMNIPVNKLNGENNLEIFSKKRILEKNENCSFCSFCNITYPISDSWCQNYYKTITDRDQRLLKTVSKEKLYNDLDHHFKIENKDIMKDINLNDCFKKTFFEFNEIESLFYYNTEIDENNHLFSKGHIKTITEEYNTENWIIKIMEWIDEHPDYVLIVNGDHGGQNFYGEDDINVHGFDNEGNEAVLFLYSKELKDNYDKLKNDNIFYTKVDPSSIISQILENINIPLQSQGVAYPIGKDPLLRYTAYKSKEIQLINQLNTYINKYPNYKDDLNKIIDKIKSNEYYKVKEEEYEKYFNEEFTNNAIDFIKLIQNEITDVLHCKNRRFFSHYCIFFIIFSIYLSSSIYQIKELYKIVNSEVLNIKLFIYVLLTSLFIIPIINFLFIFVSVYNRYVIGIFLTPFAIFISSIIIKKFILYSNNIILLDSYLFILIIGVISIVLHFSKFFIFIKEAFSKIIYSRIFNVVFLYPFLFFELYYEIKRHYKNSNIIIFKYSIYLVMRITIVLYIILLFLFDMSTENHFFSHTIFNYVITILIYTLFIFFFFISHQIINYNNLNDNQNNFGLLKLIIFLYEFYLNDESNRLMILLVYILFEYFSNFYYQDKQSKVSQVIISVLLININEIIYLITQRVYTVGGSKKVISRTILYSSETSSIMNNILFVLYKMRFPLITSTYLLNMTPIKNNILFNNDSLILRIVLIIRCHLNILFILYQFIILRNEEDFMSMMMYCVVDIFAFGFDFINIFFKLICFCKKDKSSYTSIEKP